MTERLQALFEDPEFGLTSKIKFYQKVKEKIPSITLKQIDDFFKKQAVNQIVKQVNTKDVEYNNIISFGLRNNYQIDLFILPYSKQNKNFKYLLTCIDVYSRFVDVEPIKSKTGDVVLSAFKNIIERMGVCKNLNCDEGSEFIYKPFLMYCEKNNIKIWMSNPEQENKNAIIERWHRTLRNGILRYVLVKGKGYINDIHKLVKNYNESIHSTIKLKPIDIWNEKVNPIQKLIKVEIKFKVGDRVRHIVKKQTFSKSSSSTSYTVKVYTISKIEKNSIYLDDLKKPYRDYELVLAVENENDKAEKFNKKAENDNKQERIRRRLRREGI